MGRGCPDVYKISGVLEDTTLSLGTSVDFAIEVRYCDRIVEGDWSLVSTDTTVVYVDAEIPRIHAVALGKAFLLLFDGTVDVGAVFPVTVVPAAD